MQDHAGVDAYLAGQLLPFDPVLHAALRANAEAGLPAIDVSPLQGKLLHMLASLCGARRILEIGTLGGYSTIWLARALPADGRLVSLEHHASHAAVARANIERAGLSDKVEVRTGAALDSLPGLLEPGFSPFDFVFIDADKPSNPHYLEWAARLGRPGTVIVLDNVVRGGGVADETSRDPSVLGTRAAFDLLARDPRFDATAIQTVGAKGHDGFALIRLR